jgi:acetylornithine deacetylase/succinyl-diaminopimelate desuccinylase-like protein
MLDLNMSVLLDYSRNFTNRRRWLAELGELIAFPTISAHSYHRPDLEAAARWLKNRLTRLGLENAQLLAGPNNSPPSVYADWLHTPGQPTVLLYSHYDVQPPDPLNEWRTPPFQAHIHGQYLYGRGASDDKGQLFIHLKALESYLATGRTLPVNVKVLLEGEEEIGSPNLSALIGRETSRLRADVVLISDTEMLGQNRPSIIYGLRGQLSCELEISGPRHDLHSGRYGGAVHNPLQALTELMAGMHNREGRVTIPGFYQKVREIEPAERQEIRHCGQPDAQLLTDLDIPLGWGEKGFSLFERITIRPALTINGLQGGYTGPGFKAVIPRRGLARFSFRLVPDQQPAEIAELLCRHLETIKPPTVAIRLKITGGVSPVLVTRQHQTVAAAARAVYQVWGVPPVFTRSGGTIAVVSELHRRFQVPIILLGFGLSTDNIHAPNEKFSLSNFFKGVETVITFLAELGR